MSLELNPNPPRVKDKRDPSTIALAFEEVKHPIYRIMYRDFSTKEIDISFRIGTPQKEEKTKVGLDANVICVGQFSKDIVDYLDYESNAYENVQDGAIVITTFFNCNTSDQSHQLAKALGADAWDFNTHAILKNKVNWEALRELSETCAEWGEESIQQFRCLLKEKNFICVYQPNG